MFYAQPAVLPNFVDIALDTVMGRQVGLTLNIMVFMLFSQSFNHGKHLIDFFSHFFIYSFFKFFQIFLGN